MQNEIIKSVKVLKQGGIAIFPTDTVFGVGCRIDDEKAVARLFAIKKRDESQAVPVLVDMIAMALEYVLPIPREVIDQLMKKYWPGALTIVLQSRIDNVPALVRGGSNTLGVRMPNHQTILHIIQEVGVPIIGTSANFHRAQTPTKIEELDPEFVKKVDMVVPGVCNVGVSSTVVDCSKKPWKILRQGSIHLQI